MSFFDEKNQKKRPLFLDGLKKGIKRHNTPLDKGRSKKKIYSRIKNFFAGKFRQHPPKFTDIYRKIITRKWKITLPLYFGWEFELILQRVKDWRNQIYWPFRKYWHYFGVVMLMIMAVSVVFFLKSEKRSIAATYSWVQTAWSSTSSNSAAHPADQNGWTEYSASDPYLVTGNELYLATTTASSTQTTDSDFDAGTKNNTRTANLGTEAEVTLEIQTLIKPPTYLGSYNTPGYAQDVFVTGNYAYIADRNQGAKVINVSSSTNPSLAGQYYPPGWSYSTFVVGNLLYLADNAYGLSILDVSNPNSPNLVGSYDSTTTALGVFVSGNYAYLSVDSGGLDIIDISSSTQPVLVGNVNTPGNAQNAYISGNYAYIADYDMGLQIANVATKTSPFIIASTTTTRAYDVFVYNNFAYVADEAGGLRIVNVSSPSSPRVVGTYNTPGNAFGLFVSGNFAFVADGASGLQIVDVSSSTAPVLASNYDTPNSAYGVYVLSGKAYIADYTSGLQIVDVSFLSNLRETGYTDTSGTARGVFVSSHYAYVADGDQGLRIMDVSDPVSPSESGFLDTAGNALGVSVTNGEAYVADDSNGLLSIDVSNKSSPSPADTYATLGYAKNVFIQGNYAFVAVATSGLEIVDITDPGNLSYVGSYDTAGEAYDVFVSDSIAYIADGSNGLVLLDVSSPASPAYLGSYNTAGETRGVVTSGGYAYLADMDKGVIVVNVSSTTNPTLSSGYDTTGNAYDIFLSGTNAFVADDNSGLQVIDITNPLNPNLGGALDTAGNAYGVYVYDRFAYLADGSDGLRIILTAEYVSSGYYESSVIEIVNTALGIIDWSMTSYSSTTFSFKVRSSNDPTMASAPDWTSCSEVSDGQDLSTSDCVNDIDRYLQYRVTMDTSDNIYSPELEDVAFYYDHYPSPQYLISSPYDSGEALNMISKFSWTQTSPMPGQSGVTVYLRASSTSALLSLTDWQEVASSSGSLVTLGCSELGGVVSCPNNVIPENLHDENGDRWIQYMLALTTLGSTTPALYDMNMQYVVNVRPEFDPDYPGVGDGGVSASQGTDGLVTVNYSVRDPDGSLGTFTPLEITPSFQYSTDNGQTWSDVVTGLSANATSTKSVEEINYSAYSATWSAKSQIDGTYSTTTKLRVIIDDGEGANNIASSTSAAFTLDTKDPLELQAMYVVATTTPATLNFFASDDSALEMMISLDAGYAGASYQPYAPTASTSLASDPDTVYVRFKDYYNNSIDVSATTPETPLNIIIRDVSNTNAGDYRLFVAWREVSTPLPSFAAYYVYYSLDGINFAPLTGITDRAENYFIHFNLSSSDTFYYKVASGDTDGNYSYFSYPVVSDVPDGSGGSDNTPPVISGVTTSTSTTQSATIVWNTDEPANSVVEYGLAQGVYTASTTVLTMRDSSSGLGAHSVTLVNLSASTTYYYRVQSTDATGNTATEDNSGNDYAFSTADGPVISGVTASLVTNSGATILWNTDISSDSYVVYSLNSDLSNSTEIGSSSSTQSHLVAISGLQSSTDYYYYVKSGNASDNNGNNYYYFHTSSDSAPPLISGLSAELISDTSASIIWTTDETATSKVVYGTASGVYGASLGASGNNTSHAINISGLSPSTLYYYRAVSADANGNIATSTEASFTTSEQLYTETEVEAREEAARSNVTGGGGILIVEKIVEKIIDETDKTPPAISDLFISGLTGLSATMEWTTDEAGDSFVEYGLENVNENTYGSRESTLSHQVKINNLEPSSSYKYRVTTSDAAGNLAVSDIKEFTTPSTITGDADKDQLIAALRTQIADLQGQTDQARSSIPQTVEQALDTAMDLLRRGASSMSQSLLESTIFSQFSAFEELAGLIPAPVIEGDPRVLATPNSAEISWNTNKEADSFVAYVIEETYDGSKEDPYLQVVGKPTDRTRYHTVELYDLKPDTTYHYQVRSKALIGPTRYSRDYTFRTGEEKLEIKELQIVNVSSQEATFKWITTKPTDSQLKYIPYRNNVLSVDETRIVSDKVPTTIHEMTVKDFDSGVTYSIEISGKDENGSSASEAIDAFTTSEDIFPPEIQAVQTETALSQGRDLKVQAVITWNTDEPATTKVYYDKGVSQSDSFKESTKLDNNYTKKHIVVITSFDPGSIYRYRVESVDSSGNKALSKTFTILTPRQKESVFQMIMKNIEETFGWMGKLGGR